MDFDELLSEVEGAIHGAAPIAKQSRQSNAVASSSRPSSNQGIISSAASAPSRRTNELDDLLDMVTDEDSRHRRPAPVHPRSTVASDVSKSVRDEPRASNGNKKCSQLLLSGEPTKRGLNTAFNASTACSNLRCNECDFTVVQFPGKKWSASADYMFFRENVPNEAKLRAKMELAPDFTAYACQCKWLSMDASARVDSCRVKWSCAGH